MKLGNFRKFIFLPLFASTLSVFAEDKIEFVPLINLEELSPTFEEDKVELEKIEKKNVNLNNIEIVQRWSKMVTNHPKSYKIMLRR